MLVVAFFSWWYGRGWREIFDSLGPRLRGVADSFSISQLLKTLFAPWRRIITYPGAGIDAKIRAWGDNLFSRAIGFVVRLIVIFAALTTMLVVLVLSLAEILLWPLVPIAIPAALLLGALA